MAVAFACEGNRMTVTIRDCGLAFDPETIEVPDFAGGLDSREPGGLGWHLIRSTVDEFHYESDSDGNRLTLVKSARLPEKP